jgi:hypothetical protein
MGLLFGFIILISFDFLISAPGSNSSGCWGLQFFLSLHFQTLLYQLGLADEHEQPAPSTSRMRFCVATEETPLF